MGQAKIMGVGFFGIAPMLSKYTASRRKSAPKGRRSVAIAPRSACPRAGAAGIASIESGAS